MVTQGCDKQTENLGSLHNETLQKAKKKKKLAHFKMTLY